MRSKPILFLIVALFTYLYCNSISGLGAYESFSVALLVFTLFDFLENLGKKAVVLDIAIILAVFTWLVMPVIFYQVYTKENHLARIFYKYMPIPADEYFSFVVPGTVLMIAGLKIPLAKLQINHNTKDFKDKLEVFFKGKARIGFILIGIGIASTPLNYIVPSSLDHVVALAGNLSYVGVFYIFFSENKHKTKILLGVIGLLALNALATGVFGSLVFLLALFYILIALYLKRVPFFLKLFVTITGVIFIFLLQNVKKEYRHEAWVKGSDAGLFFNLLTNEIVNPSIMFNEKKLFGMSVRMNQGWLIAVTMDQVPRKHEYAYGETIWKSVAAAFVPRIVWPDKPEAGGKYNLKRFWGYDLRGYSMNIGPIGEAYANFGTTGGIIFMFFYGLFFNIILTFLLKWSERRPSILCWIPFLFFYAVVVETDILTTVGSIVTSIIFMVVFIRLFKAVFKVNL
jgi:hypothetical protein